MASIISSNVGVSSSRKRSRHEFDAENIDVTAIGHSMENLLQHPRKRARHSIVTNSIVTQREIKKPNDTETTVSITQIDIKKNTFHYNPNDKNSRKRSYAQTDFSKNEEENKILREFSPNKKLKVQQNKKETAMMIDDDNESDQERNNIIVDDEGDLSMISSSTQTVTRRNGSKKKIETTAMPSNRVRRSGLEFCVHCGVGNES